MILPVILVSVAYLVFTFTGFGSPSTVDLGFAQIPNHGSIQITNTSTYVDESGNFHVVGEVNNTSHDPQTGVMVTAVLSDSTNNVAGNLSAFSSLDVIRPGELSPFDIVSGDLDMAGKLEFIEFSTTSQFGVEKPANLVINGSKTFLDSTGNLHITGNIINRGLSPESFLDLVATFYDKSGHGVIGTQTYGLNVGNLPQNQAVPFDVAITDNRTKSQGAFYSLNVESKQSSMGFPVNSKTSFASAGGFAGGNGFAGSSPSSGNNQVGAANNDNEQTGPSNSDEESRNSDDDNDKESRNNNNDNDDNDEESRNNNNDNDDNDEESRNSDDDNDDGDNQRGEKKTDDNGIPWFNDNNCSEEPGSSGGDSSECEEAEKEEQDEKEGEDTLEEEQDSPSDSGSTNGNNENDHNSDEGNDDEDADNSEDKGDGGNDSSSTNSD